MWSSPVAPAPMMRRRPEDKNGPVTGPNSPQSRRTDHHPDETSSLLNRPSSYAQTRLDHGESTTPPSSPPSPPSYLSHHPVYGNLNSNLNSNIMSKSNSHIIDALHSTSSSSTGNSSVPPLASSSSQDEDDDDEEAGTSGQGVGTARRRGRDDDEDSMLVDNDDDDDEDGDDDDYDDEDDDEDEDDGDDHYYDSEARSIDDPYTYSDDSASLSDAYFLQQPHSHSDTNSIFGVSVVSDTDSDRDHNRTDWTAMTPPSILNLDGLSSPSSPSPWMMMTHPKSYYLPQQLQPHHRPRTPNTIIEEDRSSEMPSDSDTSSVLHREIVVVPTQQQQQQQQVQQQNHHPLHHHHHHPPPRFYPHTSQTSASIPIPNATTPSDGRTSSSRKHPRRQHHHPRIRHRTSSSSSSAAAAAAAYRRHQQRRYYQHLQRQRQEWRERQVSQVRGRPQPTNLKTTDKFWSALFVAQVLFVCFCAGRYGSGLITTNTMTTMFWGRHQPHPAAGVAAVPFLYSSSSNNNNNYRGPQGLAVASIYNDEETNDISFNNLTTTATLPFPSQDETSSPRSDLLVGSVKDGTRGKKAGAFTIDYQNVLGLMLISGLYSCLTTYMSFAFMLIVARSLIPIMLVFTILLSLCWGLLGLTMDDGDSPGIGGQSGGDDDGNLAAQIDDPDGDDGGGGPRNFGSLVFSLGFGLFGLSLVYTMISWNRIPFCSTNLHTAICAMRSSTGILLAGVASLFVALLWMLIWTVAVMGILNRDDHARTAAGGYPPDCQPWDDCESILIIRDGLAVELALMLLSFYWTTMVIKNIVRVTVAGAVGAWWVGANMGTSATPYTTTVANGGCCGCAGSSLSCPYCTGNGNCSSSCCRGCACTSSSSTSSSSPYGCCCDFTVWDPLVRACTSSLGTICFGSLVSLPAQTTSMLGNCLCWMSGRGAHPKSHWTVTPSGGETTLGEQLAQEPPPPPPPKQPHEDYDNKDGTDAGTAMSPVEVLDGDATTGKARERQEVEVVVDRPGWSIPHVGRMLQSCNRWSFTYIGMYNYSFVEGGEKAIQLFETREWMDIVRDNLIQNTLFMASIVIGASTGTVAVVAEEVDGYVLTSMHKPIVTSFWIGFVFGFVLSNVLLLGLVGSAVNTVLVCFAAEPFEFDRNHPQLSREMREVWSQQVWEPDAEAAGSSSGGRG